MNPETILSELNAALVSTTTTFFSQLQFDSGSHQEQSPSVPVQVPVMPTPFAGELSVDFMRRWPRGQWLVPKGTVIPDGLKYDPWFVQSGPDGYTRGAWIPVEASFTQPVS